MYRTFPRREEPVRWPLRIFPWAVVPLFIAWGALLLALAPHQLGGLTAASLLELVVWTPVALAMLVIAGKKALLRRAPRPLVPLALPLVTIAGAVLRGLWLRSQLLEMTTTPHDDAIDAARMIGWRISEAYEQSVLIPLISSMLLCGAAIFYAVRVLNNAEEDAPATRISWLACAGSLMAVVGAYFAAIALSDAELRYYLRDSWAGAVPATLTLLCIVYAASASRQVGASTAVRHVLLIAGCGVCAVYHAELAQFVLNGKFIRSSHFPTTPLAAFQGWLTELDDARRVLVWGQRFSVVIVLAAGIVIIANWRELSKAYLRAYRGSAMAFFAALLLLVATPTLSIAIFFDAFAAIVAPTVMNDAEALRDDPLVALPIARDSGGDCRGPALSVGSATISLNGRSIGPKSILTTKEDLGIIRASLVDALFPVTSVPPSVESIYGPRVQIAADRREPVAPLIDLFEKVLSDRRKIRSGELLSLFFLHELSEPLTATWPVRDERAAGLRGVTGVRIGAPAPLTRVLRVEDDGDCLVACSGCAVPNAKGDALDRLACPGLDAQLTCKALWPSERPLSLVLRDELMEADPRANIVIIPNHQTTVQRLLDIVVALEDAQPEGWWPSRVWVMPPAE